jgi:hypothetical protein
MMQLLELVAGLGCGAGSNVQLSSADTMKRELASNLGVFASVGFEPCATARS